MKPLTVFTPTYNRKHTLPRTFESLKRQTCRDFEWMIIDDGSSDGTRELVRSWGSVSESSASLVDWMGRVDERSSGEAFCVDAPLAEGCFLHIIYIYKENGGLYTGYNTAYANINTELCVCIDSDDFMPDDAVEKIVEKWSNLGAEEKERYCGIEGLDFNILNNQPIGGYFPIGLTEAYKCEIPHRGDTKQVLRTDLMRKVSPMIGFEGEKNFNPIYMIINVCDRYPLLILNENLCTVEYQMGADSMSQGIFRQYVNSPRSFAKMRLQEMDFIHNSLKGRFRSAVHYVSSCIIARDKNWLRNSNRKMITILASPLGVMLYLYIYFKTRS